MGNYDAAQKKWIISKTTLTFQWTVAAGNGTSTQQTSKEIPVIFDKLNCYRGDLLV